jgi:hypothetical protein
MASPTTRDNGDVTPAQLLARAGMYSDAGIRAFEQGQSSAWDIELPEYPGERCEGLVNCLPGDAVVDTTLPRNAYRRWYDGQVVRIQTASGHELTITPNHPVLTDRGWVAAGALTVGSRLMRSALRDGLAFRAPDIEDRPSTISEVYGAIEQLRHPHRVVGISPDFHGDGQNGYVDVVVASASDADALLRTDSETARAEPGAQLRFADADVVRPLVVLTDRRVCGRRRASWAGRANAALSVSAQVSHALVHGLAAVAWRTPAPTSRVRMTLRVTLTQRQPFRSHQPGSA